MIGLMFKALLHRVQCQLFIQKMVKEKKRRTTKVSKRLNKKKKVVKKRGGVVKKGRNASGKGKDSKVKKLIRLFRSKRKKR